MRVLMFGWEFPPKITGGLGTACYGLTKGLANAGATILFVMPNASHKEDQSFVKIINANEVNIDPRHIQTFPHQVSFVQINSQMVPYIGIDEYYNLVDQLQSNVLTSEITKNGHRYNFSGKYGKHLMHEVEQYALVAAELAQTQNFDLIHAHDWLTYKAGIAAKKLSGKPLIVHVHATEYDRSGENNRNSFVMEIEKAGMQAADAICTVSHLTREIVINKYGINPQKVFTLHNAVEPSSKQIIRKKAIKEKIVTFLGRVTFQKGPEYFVESAKLVLEKDSNVRFVLAGDGDLLPQIIKRVAELGISDKFHFTGFLQGTEVDKMFGMSDVYVMPSISEPFGISPLEAMAANVPVIISKQSGVAEVLTHAIKVDFWDINAMADAIYGILHYPALSQFFTQKGKEDVDALKWDIVGNKLLEIYHQILKK